MPSTNAKQHKFMEAIAHSPSFAKKVGVPQSVGKDFSTADKGKTFKKGGDMATMDPKMMAMKSAKRRGASMAPTGMAGMGGMGMKNVSTEAYATSGIVGSSTSIPFKINIDKREAIADTRRKHLQYMEWLKDHLSKLPSHYEFLKNKIYGGVDEHL